MKIRDLLTLTEPHVFTGYYKRFEIRDLHRYDIDLKTVLIEENRDIAYLCELTGKIGRDLDFLQIEDFLEYQYSRSIDPKKLLNVFEFQLLPMMRESDLVGYSKRAEMLSFWINEKRQINQSTPSVSKPENDNKQPYYKPLGERTLKMYCEIGTMYKFERLDKSKKAVIELVKKRFNRDEKTIYKALKYNKL